MFVLVVGWTMKESEHGCLLLWSLGRASSSTYMDCPERCGGAVIMTEAVVLALVLHPYPASVGQSAGAQSGRRGYLDLLLEGSRMGGSV